MNLPVAEDDVVIFPSKTYHATEPNQTDGPRVSISVDVVVALKDSAGVEFVMPPVRQWRLSGDFRETRAAGTGPVCRTLRVGGPRGTDGAGLRRRQGRLGRG